MVEVKRSAEQEPLVELLALVAIPGAPLVARDLPPAGQRFEGAKGIAFAASLVGLVALITVVSTLMFAPESL